MPSLFYSLRGKIIFLICGIILAASLVIGFFAFFQTTQFAIHSATEDLAHETRLMALEVKNAYEEMENDAFIIAQTPPIEGLIRSLRNRGVDSLDASTTKRWRKRLETIFFSVMKSRPHYTQMRYIGVANQGRELVRVNRTERGLESVPLKKLQSKEGESYFKRGVQAEKGQRIFSEVTYNRERGQVDETMSPTVRVVVPVHDGDELFGMVVINADYRQLMKKTFQKVKPSKNMFIINRFGDFIEYKRAGKMLDFEFHNNYTAPPPSFVEQVKNAAVDEGTFTEDGKIAHFVKLTVDSNNPDAFWGVVLRVPKSELLSKVRKEQTDAFLLVSSIILFCLFVSIWASKKLTFSLERMADQIMQADGDHTRILDLPMRSKDEVGGLARAFRDVANNLRESKTKARAVLDHAADGIMTIDASNNIDSFNPACEKIFGYKAREVIGENIDVLKLGHYFEAYEKCLDNDQKKNGEKFTGISLEAEARRKDETMFPIDLSISETYIDGERLLTSIVRDITERKQMEVMKDEFISTVNHELRTPLASIQGALGLLRTRMDTMDNKGKRLLQLSYNNCDRLARLVNDIADIEKMAAGKIQYKIETLELCGLVNDIVERHQSYAEIYGVTFDVKMEVEKVYGRVDSCRLNQALVNLISNAAKFSPKGEAVTITVAMKDERHVQISVADNGPGIPEEFQEKIFEKFTQADSSSTRNRGGTGLGLGIAKSIIEAFNGKILFETEKGKGTIFYLVLPICKAPKEEKTDEKSDLQPA